MGDPRELITESIGILSERFPELRAEIESVHQALTIGSTEAYRRFEVLVGKLFGSVGRNNLTDEERLVIRDALLACEQYLGNALYLRYESADDGKSSIHRLWQGMRDVIANFFDLRSW